MSLKLTKAQLGYLLLDNDNKVIALTGKWGTGKSYMWEEVKSSSEDELVKNSIYASLFGLSSVDQIKMKLLQCAIPAAEKNQKLWESAKLGLQSTLKILEGFHASFGAINNIGLVVAPSILQNRVIVLDDIERKHQNLHIDEVLGFIDEYTQQRGSRFVLILNSDKLDNREVWDTLREKVVDQELCLKTTTSEAFDIALQLTPSPYASHIKKSIEVCELTNIRIAQKVIKAVNRVLGNHPGLSEEVLTRVIPSTVLLATIHYKGIEDGPDFDFVLGQGTARDWEAGAGKKVDETEDGKRKSKWKMLLQQLSILGCDEFEVLVIEFLQSGLFDGEKIGTIIQRYLMEEDQLKARNDFNKFVEGLVWDHTKSVEDIVDEAEAFAPRIKMLDAYSVTYFHKRVSDLPGGKIIADAALDNWIAEIKDKFKDSVPDEGLFIHELHPRIKEEFQKISAEYQQALTPFDVCVQVKKHNGWGVRQELVMKSSTVKEMDTLIRTLPIPDLRLFLVCMLDFAVHKETYKKHWGSAMDNFLEACRDISQDPASGRLGNLLKGLFADTGRPDLLDPGMAAEATQP